MHTPPPHDDDEINQEAAALPVAAFDPAWAEKGLKQIQRVLYGNGISPKDVTLEKAEGGIYEFYAATFMELEPEVVQSKRPGKFNAGEVVEPNRLEPAIQSFISRAMTDQNIIRHVHQVVETRPDKGFGLEGNERTPLKGSEKIFCVHEPCQSCNGETTEICKWCNGQQYIHCVRCQARGHVPCTWCNATGHIQTPQGSHGCTHCNGTGHMVCQTCMGKGQEPCRECNATGRMTCETCKGQGWTTHTWTVGLNARARGKVLYDALGGEVKVAIARLTAGALARSGDIQVNVLSEYDSRAVRQLIQPDSQSVISAIYYKAQIPVARLEIKTGKSYVKPLLAGFQGHITDCPPFLERFIRPALEALDAASKGGVDAADQLKIALKYRIVQFVLQGISKARAKQVLAVLLKNYPIGLSERTAKTLIGLLSRAIQKLSFWPNVLGVGFSVTLAILFIAAYIYLGLGNWLHQQLGLIPPALYLFDGAALLGVVLLNLMISRVAGAIALRRTLKALGMDMLKLTLPPAGMVAYGGAALVFIGGILFYWLPRFV